MALFRFSKKKVPACTCNRNCDVMDAEVTEIDENDNQTLQEKFKEAIRKMGLRMTEAPCPCSVRRGGQPHQR